MKYGAWDVGGETIRMDENYCVKDNKYLERLILSSTRLNANRSTRGHKHAGQEEIYFFVEGGGEMQVGGDKFKVRTGDTVLIADGEYHRVWAGNEGCYFICVFDGERHSSPVRPNSVS